MVRKFIPLILSFAALFGLWQTAYAEEIKWRVRSQTAETIHLKFHSKEGERTWPDGKQVYAIPKGKTYSIRVSCEPEELVCYGAWIADNKNVYWGVGPNNENECTNCCKVCGSGDEQINLAR